MVRAGWIAVSVAVLAASLLLVAVPVHAAEPSKAVVWEHFASKRTSDPELWIAKPDGSGARRLARGELPDVSPDGRWVAYTSSATGEHQLYVVPSSGGTPRVVFSPHDYVAEHSFTWSADSSRIFFGGESYDGWLVGAYDVNSGETVSLNSSLHPYQVALVPGSNELFVLQDDTQLFLLHSDSRIARPLAELNRPVADRVFASPTTLAFNVFSYRSVGPSLDSVLKEQELWTVDLGSGKLRKFGSGLRPIGWSADQRTLDVSQLICSKRICRARLATLDPVSGAIRPGTSLGKTTVRIRKLRSRKRGRPKQRVTVRSNHLVALAYSTDGSALLAWRSRFIGRGRTLDAAYSKADTEIPLIVSMPRAGGPAVPIGRGRNPDWNL